ncbi:baseplate J/gp47 family protein [Anaeromicropila populeti]|uniref:Putative baseplate assembly protein n=1 Tax=Anaeromicropila populeti TaxID=37658 RepID=A0A1I6LTM4_9FIRM|nr:baseplate J/gp47 family protein [Anaeromicropila populeti]SFS06837.1 putative baseplate assembly protein [Anaeromicropila populeti]
MLPNLELDTENFDEIMDEARSMISSIYPEWTDFNYHDPGITLIELFAWLIESLQYFLDQISEDNLVKYLKILGTKRKNKVCARALVNVVPETDFIVMKGTKLYAGKVCFETNCKNYMVKGDITKCFYGGKAQTSRKQLAETRQFVEVVDKAQLEFGHKLKQMMFGKNPVPGDCYYIGLAQTLPDSIEISIYMEIEEDYPVKRNPIQQQLYAPLAAFRLQYSTKDGWKDVRGLRDETYGLLISGQIYFTLEEEMTDIIVCGENSYYLRLLLTESNYDAAPIVHGMSINVLPVEQKDTLIESVDVSKEQLIKMENCQIAAETFLSFHGVNRLYLKRGEVYFPVETFTKCLNYDKGCSTYFFTGDAEELDGARIISYLSENEAKVELGIGNGFPFQEYNLFDSDMEYESFEILVQEIENKNGFSQWTKVVDFGNSKPWDKHYVFDSRKGTVEFGDCIHGMAPEGRILVSSYARTVGMNGNVKENKINYFGDMTADNILIYNKEGAVGGRNEETMEESFLRVRANLKSSFAAVTYEDYERYVKETPGLMIESCKVISSVQMKQSHLNADETIVNIVVKPFTYQIRNKLSSCYEKNILMYLEQYRLVGTKINLLSPQYIRIELYIDIIFRPQFTDAKEQIKNTVESYFKNLSREFGTTVIYSRIYGILDILECVSHVKSLTIEAKGSGVTKSLDGNITLPPNGVVELGEVQYLFSIED